MQLKWIEPESRFIMRSLFKRNFDTFSEEAQRTVNWSVLTADIVSVMILISLL